MKLIILDSSRGKPIENVNGRFIVNLNALINKEFNKDIVEELLKEVKDLKELSIGNLASLCFKLNLNYDSTMITNMVREVIKIIKSINPDIQILFDNKLNYLEEGIRPYKKLFYKEEDNLYIVKPLVDILNIIGFVKPQIIGLLIKENNFIQYIPEDLMKRIPTNFNTYKKLTERYFK